ncbi:Rnf5 [Symbiodinium sp. KB8]|nr:Rnf5 [Symbiodinium sp. KB8]
MDPHLLILLLCLGLLLLAARAARRILYRACVPRSPALRRTSWRDLCLLRSDRLSDWPVLEAAFEISRLEWLAIHGAPPIALRPEVRCAIRVPPVLVDHSQLCLQDLADVERQNVMWQSFSFFNALFFHGQLQVDDIRFRASVPGSLDAAEGAEAAVRCEFSGDFTSAMLWIEFVWPCCKSWTLMRTASVLLHEMVHVWHDSSWTRLDQLSTPHSATFLRMCADLNQKCQEEEFPFFPNIFTESWVLLVSDELGEFGAFCAGPQPEGDFGHRWMNLLTRNGHFKGNLLGDLQELGISLLDAIAPMSIKSMEQGRNSVQLQWMTQNILDEVITDPGLKFVGLGNYLIEFPATFNTMYFIQDGRGVAGASVPELFEPMLRGPIRARSADGLEMLVSVSFQWRLRSDALKDLYNILGETMYRDEFVRFARAAIIESCSLFTADQYFTERTTITSKMLEVLQSNFDKPELGLRMEITGLQLREVDLPDDYDDEIENTQEQMQEVEVGKAERQEQIIIKEAEKLVAIQQVEELLRGARGFARRIDLQNQATITQLKLVQQKQAEANAAILQQFANETQAFDRLFEVMEIRALEDHEAERMAVSL